MKSLLSMNAGKETFCNPWIQERIVSKIHGCRKGKFLLSMDASKIVSVIHGCRNRKSLLSTNAGKESFCYQWMQEKIVSAIHGYREKKSLLSMNVEKGKFLLSLDAGKGSFCYPWMHRKVASAIHGCRKRKSLLSMNAGKESLCYPWMHEKKVSAIHGWCKRKSLVSLSETTTYAWELCPNLCSTCKWWYHPFTILILKVSFYNFKSTSSVTVNLNLCKWRDSKGSSPSKGIYLHGINLSGAVCFRE